MTPQDIFSAKLQNKLFGDKYEQNETKFKCFGDNMIVGFLEFTPCQDTVTYDVKLIYSISWVILV